MRRVQQKKGFNDCGVCCVCILAGVSYRQALAAVFPRSAPEPKHMWTSSRQLSAALNRCGLKCDERARPLFGRSYKELQHDAILIADRDPKTWCWHWVVWDWKRKRVLDPARRRKSRWRVTSFLKVYRD